jgi:hypothetical protein
LACWNAPDGFFPSGVSLRSQNENRSSGQKDERIFNERCALGQASGLRAVVHDITGGVALLRGPQSHADGLAGLLLRCEEQSADAALLILMLTHHTICLEAINRNNKQNQNTQ